MTDETEKSIIQKIIKEEKDKERTYPNDDEFIRLSKEIQIEQEKIAGKVLGRIMDKLELARQFLDLIPIYYDEAGIFWMFDVVERYWKMIDDVDILNYIDGSADCNIISSRERNELLNAIKQISRSKKPKELDRNFIQFGKEIINFVTGDRFPATSEYFITNPIPHRLGTSTDTPRIDSLFKSWVKPEDVPKLYEIIAYSMLCDYPIERIFCLHGAGSNGKSVYRQILRKTIGEKNCVSTSLETLCRSRFESAKLYKKLVCEMGETNLAKLENTQIVKRLTSGKDLVGMEYKNKNTFDTINYAKLIISTNNIPPTDDKTDGFYRRWLIIDFPNTFEIERDVLSEIPEEEYRNLCIKCIDIIYNLLKTRSFANEGDFKKRRERYEERSDPLEKFWNIFIDDSNPNSDIPGWEFSKRLNEWLRDNKFREIGDITINRYMRDKHIQQARLYKEWYENQSATKKMFRCWVGIKWKE